MALTNEEKETIIQYCDADKMATVYTCNNALMNKLDKQENYRELTEEQKKEIAERLKRGRE